MTIPAVSWVVGDIETPLQGYSAGTTAFGGMSQMRGAIRESDARRYPSSVAQGSTVTGYTQGGVVVYQGRLSAPPVIRGGLATFAAQGESVRAAKRATRLLYQTRNLSEFVPDDSAPYNVTHQGANKIQVQSSGNSLRWTFNDGESMLTNDENGFAMAAPGSPGGISRYAFDWTFPAFQGGTAWRIHKADYPLVGDTFVQEIAIGGLGSQDTTISDPKETLRLFLKFTSNQTVAGSKLYVIHNARFNGIAGGDTYYAHQVIADVGGRLGYNVGQLPGSSLNVLPLDWTSGSWAELLSYIATLDDRYWRVVEDSRLEYDAWGTKEWTVYQADGATVDLTPLELYNQVTVKYVDVGGAPREVTVTASPDPLALSGIVNVWEESLADVQPDSTLATAVANNLIGRISSQRYQGRIDCVKAYDSTGREAVREIRAGDTVRVADWDLGQSVTLRVFETEQTPNGVALGIEGAVSIASMLGRARLAAARAPSMAELPDLEIAAVAAEPFPSEEQQHRDRFLTWPQGFPKRGTGHGRG